MIEWWLLLSFIVLVALALPVLIYPLRRFRKLLLGLIPCWMALLFLGYWQWGGWANWQAYLIKERQQQKIAALMDRVTPADLILQMKAKLEANPQQAQGWYLLGRLYAAQDQWLAARDAFAKAKAINPDEERVLVNFAQSLWQINKQKADPEIRHLFQDILQKNPQQPDALALLAMDAFQQQQFALAIEYWQRLLKLAPEQSSEAQMIRKAIAKAQQQLH